jgi:serine/threonine-protein kinase
MTLGHDDTEPLFPPSEAADPPLEDDGRASPERPAETLEGSLVGAYRIVRELGRGGMAVVYLATRVDGGFTQEVALKLIRRGVDTDDVIARFRQERQILASLNHPNIAQLVDGGIAPDGRPFLAMELVRGEPIDRFCDAHHLSIDERIDLCAAVGGPCMRIARSLSIAT